jgi:hypothetical protein
LKGGKWRFLSVSKSVTEIKMENEPSHNFPLEKGDKGGF